MCYYVGFDGYSLLNKLLLLCLINKNFTPYLTITFTLCLINNI